MAKTDSDSIPAIDDDTRQMLEEQVNKGKARKFILIFRGATIKKLIVFRKGPFNSKIQAARKAGAKGDVVCGIVKGSGKNVSFQMAGTPDVAKAMDVGEAKKEPPQVEKLRKFLKDQRLTRVPEYKLLQDEQEVVTLLGTPQAAKAASAVETETELPDATKGSDSEAQARADQLKRAIFPKVKAAVANDPSQSKLIKELVKTVAEAEKAQSFGDMLRALERLGISVKEALEGGGDKTDYEAEVPGAEQQVVTLKKHPRHAGIADEIRELDGYLKAAKDHAKNNDYAEALTALEKVDDGFDPALAMADRIDAFRKAEATLREKLADLQQHQGFAAIDDAKRNEIDQKFHDADAKIVARDFDDARTILRDIKAKLKAYRTQSHQHGDYIGLRSNARLLVEALNSHPNAEAIKSRIEKIQTQYIDKAHTEYVRDHDYRKAKRLLDRVQGKYDDAKAVADKKSKQRYDKLCGAIQKKIEDLDVEQNQAFIADELAAAKALCEQSKKYAETSQFPDAESLLGDANRKCDAAAAEVKRQQDFAAAEAALGKATDELGDKPQAAVKAVQKLHDQLKAHPQHAVVDEDLTAVQAKIDSASQLISA